MTQNCVAANNGGIDDGNLFIFYGSAEWKPKTKGERAETLLEIGGRHAAEAFFLFSNCHSAPFPSVNKLTRIS